MVKPSSAHDSHSNRPFYYHGRWTNERVEVSFTGALWRVWRNVMFKKRSEPGDMRGAKGAEAHSGYVSACVFSADGRLVLSGSMDHTLKLWDVATGSCQATLEGHRGRILGCAFLPDVKIYQPFRCGRCGSGRRGQTGFRDYRHSI